MISKKDRVYIFDTTLRDGEQSPGASMNPAEKMRIARQLEKMGVDVIEAGFPVASEGDFASVQQIARAIKGSQVAALADGLGGYRSGLGCRKGCETPPCAYLYFLIRYPFEISTP